MAALHAGMPLRNLETPEQSPTAIRRLAEGRDKRSPTAQEVSIFSVEYRKLMVRALLVAGVSLGVAEDIARMGEFADAMSGTGVSELLRHLPDLYKRPRVAPVIVRLETGSRISPDLTPHS